MGITSSFPSGGAVVGVKGDAETVYRKGRVNITPANIGAYSKSEVDARINTNVVNHTIYMSTLYNVANHKVTFNS